MGKDRTEVSGTAIVCPACGEENPSRAKFCNECGDSLRGRAVAPSDARKTVTIVFSDLVGSTALQAALDPESVRHVMGRFYAAMSAELERHGGRVEKFIGDAVMAVFGTPVVREDDAVRAVRAADAMRSALTTLNHELDDRWGIRLGMRTGVNTGEVVTSREGFMVGDTVNVAARLEQSAADGEVLVGEPTWRLTRHDARFEEVAPLAVKGKTEPLPAYRLLGATPGPEERGRLEAPLVGREDELGCLRTAFAGAVADRVCRLVTIIGSPGLGKTRLAQEFAGEIADRATVVEGRCEPSGEGITFLPVAEVLRDAAGIGEADSSEQVRDKLTALVPDDPDRELLVERAAGVLGVTQVAGTEETFWSVRRLLGGLARERPLVVLLDDVHWGQPTFLDLIEHLVEWGRESPILLLAMARPELRDSRPSLTDPGRMAAAVVELAPLRPETSRQLASELLDRSELPDALAQRILQTTEGNPLFLGEMLRMLVDDGVLRREGERWVAAGDAAGVDVPPTITALLAARIERLGADERSVVERASVIGKQFYRGAVAELASAAVAAGIDGHLEALHRKEVVEPDGTLWIDEPVFRFHHVLIRDAAYRGLLKEARAELHERFADWLQAKAGELVGEHEEVIAFHIEQAHDYRRQLGPLDERGRALGERAVARLHSAGRRALAREDLPAATNLLRRAAAALAEQSPEAGDVLVDLLEALLSAGETGETASILDRLAGPAADDPRLCAWMTVAGAQLAHMTDSTRLQDTLDDVAAAAETLAAAGDDAGVAKAHHVRAQGLALLGQVGEVEAALDHALAAARRAQDARRATAVLSGAPRAALWGPSPIMRASGRCLDVVRILRMTQGNRHVEAVALRCQAVLEAMRGRADAARQILDRCRMTLEELGLGLELLETEVHAGIVEIVAGDFAAAETSLRVAHDGFVVRGLDVGAASSASLLARAVLEQGRDDEAEVLTRFSEEHGGESLKTTIAWCGVRARVLARRGEHADAEALARRAVDVADATDALVDHGDARMDLAHVLRAAGRDDEAAAQARRAGELYEAKGHEVAARRAAGFAGEQHAGPSAAGLVAAPTGVEGAIAQVGRRLRAAFDRRDWEAVRACVTDDMVALDRRPASPRGDTRGATAFCAGLRTYVDAAPDARMPYSQLVESGDLGLAQIIITGHQADGGGAFVIPVLIVQRGVDGRFDRMEFFNPEDERAALDRLLELQPEAAVRAAWKQQLEFMAAVNACDVEALGATLAEDVELVDHRQAGWGKVRGRGDVVDGFRSTVANLPKSRMHVELVETVGADAAMARIHVEGGDVAIDFGQVVVLRDGVATRVELFEPGDGARMRTCFEGCRALAMPTGVGAVNGRAGERLCAAFDRRDWDAMRDCVTDDVVIVDRRLASPRGDTGGATAFCDRLRAFVDVADDALIRYDELVAAEGFDLVTSTVTGHQSDTEAAFVIPILQVVRYDGDRIDHMEFFDPEDERAALDRLLELQPDPVVRAAWRQQLALMAAVNAGDLDALGATLAEDVELIDHRQVGWGEVRGRGDVAAGFRPAGRTHVELVETAGADAVMSRIHVQGGDGASDFGQVVVLRGGVVSRIELFEPSDERAMRACLSRYRAAGAPVPARAVMDTAWQQCVDRFAQAANRRDWTAFAACLSPDFQAVDHRTLATFGGTHGSEAWVEYAQGIPALSRDAVLSFPQFAGDGRIGAAHGSWTGHQDDGGGGFTFAAIIVIGVGVEGIERFEYFDPDDERGACERLLALGSDTDVRAAWRPQLEALTAINARDWPELERCYAPDAVLVDHREGRAREPQGRDALVGLARSLLDAVPDGRAAVQFLDAGPGTATSRLHLYGRDGTAVEVGQSVVLRDGWIIRVELSDLDDDHGPTTRVWLRAVAAVNQRDWDGLAACALPELAVVDHRRLATVGALHSADAFFERLRAVVAVAHDAVVSVEPLGETAGVARAIGRWTGHYDEGGGAFELPFGVVVEARDDVLVRYEMFDEDDERGMLEAAARLRSASSPGPRRAEAVANDLAAALNERRWPELEALVAPDIRLTDHRVAGAWGEEVRDREAWFARVRELPELSPGSRHAFEVLSAAEHAIAMRWTTTGTYALGRGAFELCYRIVAGQRGGRMAVIDFFELEDEARMQARFEELRRAAGGPDEHVGPATRVILESASAANRRDWDDVLARILPEIEIADHRTPATIGTIHSAEAFVDLMRSVVAVADDAVLSFEPLDESAGVASGIGRWSGHYDEGGGAFELTFGAVFEARGDVLVRHERFDEDDEQRMRLAAERMRSGAATAAAVAYAFVAAVNARHWTELESLIAKDLRLVDHRIAGAWGDEVRDREAFLARARELVELAPDSRHAIELIDATEHVVAMVWTTTGTYALGGGAFELGRGVVAYVRDGRYAISDFFEPDDEAGIRARFDELAAQESDGNLIAQIRSEQRRAGERAVAPGLAVVQHIGERINARDFEAVHDAMTEDYVAVDHRPVSAVFHDRPGRVEHVERIRSMTEIAGDARFIIRKPIGELDGVWLGFAGWVGHQDEGGGAFETIFRGVWTTRGEQLAHLELFELDDEGAALRAMMRQVGGPGTERASPTTDVVFRVAEAINARHWGDLRALEAPDIKVVDHRTVVGLGFAGTESMVERAQSLIAVATDARASLEPLAELDGVAMTIIRWQGHMVDGGGPFELRFRGTWVAERGRATRYDLFDEDDEVGMLAAAARHRGTAPATAPPNLVVQFYTRLCEAFNARDWDAFAAVFTQDITFADRRALKIWPTLRGRAEMMAMWQNTLTMSPDLTSSFEFVEGDDETAIVHYYFRGHAADGGGELELGSGNVCVMRGELAHYGEGFDHEDLETMRARREQLRPLARRRAGADLPPEPLPAEHAAMRSVEALEAAVNTGDGASLRAVLTPGFTIVDHRLGSTFGDEVQDREAFIERERALAASSLDVTMRFAVLAASETLTAGIISNTGRLVDGGGSYEILIGLVMEYRDGRLDRAQLFDPDDESALLARFEELEDGARSSSTGPAGRIAERFATCINARDFVGLADCMTERFVLVDQRSVSPLGHGDRGKVLDAIRSMVEIATDVRFAVHSIGEIDGVWLGQAGWVGHQDESGAAFEIRFRQIWVGQGEWGARAELFDLEDEAAALRAMMRLLGGDAGDTGTGPATDLVLRLAGALAERDWDRVQACFAADLELVDHRRVSTLGFDLPGGEGFVRRVRALVDVAADAQPEIEPLAELGGLVMMTVGWSGHMDAGGGSFALRWRGVVAVRDGVAVRYELFDENDEAGMLARVGELVDTEPPVAENLIATLYTRHCEAFNRRDWPGVVVGLAKDYVLIDRRPVTGWPMLKGPAEFEAMWRDLTTMSADLELSSALVEGDDEVAIIRYRARGRADGDGGGGAFEVVAGLVQVQRGGLCAHCEVFELDDLETMRVRSEELRPLARRRPGADLPPEPLPSEQLVFRLLEAAEAQDWDAMTAELHPEFEVVDHRALSMYGDEVRDREAMVARQRALAASAVEVTRRLEVIAASETTVAGVLTARGRMVDGGGPFEDVLAVVATMRDSSLGRMDLFEPDDEAGMLARFDAVVAAERNLSAQVYARHVEAFNARDWPQVTASFAEEFTLVDHRPVTGWPVLRGRHEFESMWRDLLTMSPDLQSFYEFVEGDDECAILRYGIRGHATEADGGGELEASALNVSVTRAGLGCHIELFPLDHELETLRARCEELRPLARRRPGTDLPDEPLPSEHAVLRICAALDAGDWETVGTMMDPRFTLVDRRSVSVLGEVQDRDAFIAADRVLGEMMVDSVRRCEVIAATSTSLAGIVTMRGRMVDGDGPFELVFGAVAEWDDGRFLRWEFLEPDDEDALLARLAELGADDAGKEA